MGGKEGERGRVGLRMLALYFVLCAWCALTGQFHARALSFLAVALTARVRGLPCSYLVWLQPAVSSFYAVPFRMLCFSCSPPFSPTAALDWALSYLDGTRSRTGQA